MGGIVFEPSITIGAIFSAFASMVVFVGSLIWYSGRFTVKMDLFTKNLEAQFTKMDKRLEKAEQCLVEIATTKVEMAALNKRVDDIQRHGSHRLAEIVEQAIADRRERQREQSPRL